MFETTIQNYLITRGFGGVRYISLDSVPENQRMNCDRAVFFWKPLSRAYLRSCAQDKEPENGNEFHALEEEAERASNQIAGMLHAEGYIAAGDAEQAKAFDHERLYWPLPLKTLAVMSGIGWVGKSNLLVTEKYGSGFVMGSVLTNAPIDTAVYEPMKNLCGICERCAEICPSHCLRGTSWHKGMERAEIINVFECHHCQKCMFLCPWTLRYAQGEPK